MSDMEPWTILIPTHFTPTPMHTDHAAVVEASDGEEVCLEFKTSSEQSELIWSEAWLQNELVNFINRIQHFVVIYMLCM